MTKKNVYILGSKRIPFVKSFTTYSNSNNQEMYTHVLKAITEEFKLKGKHIGEVTGGAVMKHSSDWNLVRECVMGSGLNPSTPGYDVQKACGTGLEAIINIANKIALGQIDSGIGGGTDTNSDAPIVLNREAGKKFIKLSQARSTKDKLMTITDFRPKDLLPVAPAVIEPRTGLSMGQSAEKMVKRWNITREAQDELAYSSHQNAEKAYQNGFYKDLVIEFTGINKDGIVRGSTTKEKLASLRTVFDRTSEGSLTAGNSTPLTDGAAAALLGSKEFAEENNLPTLAKFVDGQSWAVDYVSGAGLLMAPTVAVGKLLMRNNLSLQDFDFYEIHEAFAGQVLCTLKAWEDDEYCQKMIGAEKALGSIDRNKMNIKGGSLAVGHPFAATGGRIVGSLAKIIHENGGGRGLISICTAGGMGVAAILEGA